MKAPPDPSAEAVPGGHEKGGGLCLRQCLEDRTYSVIKMTMDTAQRLVVYLFIFRSLGLALHYGWTSTLSGQRRVSASVTEVV